jgi:hypothetical protein
MFQVKQQIYCICQWQGGWPCDGPHYNSRLNRTDMTQFWDTDHLTSAALSLASSSICATNHIGQTHRENLKHWFLLHFNMADCQKLHCRLQAADMKFPQSIKRRMKNSIMWNMIIKKDMKRTTVKIREMFKLTLFRDCSRQMNRDY